ncbi:histone-fold-containing protein [Fomitopsis betulina]|nr:histone-fold-containing protein [Fomitopsis betulina]
MVSNNKESASSVNALAQQEAVSEGIEAFELPRSIITRLARSAMSENTKMSKDVVLSFQKSSTVFINYLAATAHEVAASKQHKSISATDVLKALELVEMGDMVPKLQQELQLYRDVQKSGRSGKGKARESLAEGKAASAASSSRPRQKKEKERGPTITINRPQAKAPSRALEPQYEPAGVNGRVHEARDEDEDMVEEDEEVDDEDDDDDGDEDVGDEEPEEPMAVDDEDTRPDEGLDDEDDGE